MSIRMATTLTFLILSGASRGTTITEEPVKVIDVPAEIAKRMAPLRPDYTNEIALFINRRARTNSPWGSFAAPSVHDSDAVRMYGKQWVWSVADLRAATVKYDVGAEQALAGEAGLTSRAHRHYLHANCSNKDLDFDVKFSETLHEQRSWTFKKTIADSLRVKLTFGLSKSLGGEAESNQTVTTERSTGSLKDQSVTWEVNRKVPIGAHSVTMVKVERDVRSLRIPFKATILVDGDVVVAPSPGLKKIPFGKQLSDLLPDPVDRTFVVEGYIDDVSLGDENFLIQAKAILPDLIADEGACNRKDANYWNAFFVSSEASKSPAIAPFGESRVPSVSPLGVSNEGESSCSASNDVGETCSISCPEGAAARCQNGTGGTPPRCECDSN